MYLQRSARRRRGVGFYPGESCYDPKKFSWLPNTSTADSLTELGCWLGLSSTPPTVATIPVRAMPGSSCPGTLNADGSCSALPGTGSPAEYSSDSLAFSAWRQGMADGSRTAFDLTASECSAGGWSWDPKSQACAAPGSSGVPGWAWGLIAAVALVGAGFFQGKR